MYRLNFAAGSKLDRTKSKAQKIVYIWLSCQSLDIYLFWDEFTNSTKRNCFVWIEFLGRCAFKPPLGELFNGALLIQSYCVFDCFEKWAWIVFFVVQHARFNQYIASVIVLLRFYRLTNVKSLDPSQKNCHGRFETFKFSWSKIADNKSHCLDPREISNFNNPNRPDRPTINSHRPALLCWSEILWNNLP